MLVQLVGLTRHPAFRKLVTADIPYNVQVFSANGTWTKPSYGSIVRVTVCGGGGGGGSGRRGAAGASGGGGGGASGDCTTAEFYQTICHRQSQ